MTASGTPTKTASLTVQNFKGEVYVENTYDSEGRVIHQYAADIGTFDFTYDPENRRNTSTGERWLLFIHRV